MKSEKTGNTPPILLGSNLTRRSVQMSRHELDRRFGTNLPDGQDAGQRGVKGGVGPPPTQTPHVQRSARRIKVGKGEIDRFEAIWIDSDNLKILEFFLGSDGIFSGIRHEFHSDSTGFDSDPTGFDPDLSQGQVGAGPGEPLYRF